MSLIKMSDKIEKRYAIGSNLIPPKHLWSSFGQANLYESGLAYFKYFLDYCNLDRNANVLDIGCSIGRMAIPLTAYLTKEASYEGFDIVPASIDYCQKHITPTFPNFQFQLADVYNSFYNINGNQKPEDYKFPFPSDNFDLVYSTSVFTHMSLEAIENYLQEISRVLRGGGYSFHTIYLLDKESLAGIKQKKCKPNFKYDMKTYMTSSKEHIEALIAFHETDIVKIHEKNNLNIENILHGHWRTKTYPKTYYNSEKKYLGSQDAIVSKKISSE